MSTKCTKILPHPLNGTFAQLAYPIGY